MFGLQVPISKSSTKNDFDSVQTILSHSVYKNASSFWQSRADEKGHLLYVELNKEDSPPRKLSGCACGTHNGFATDDTGYGTDNEVEILATGLSGSRTKNIEKSSRLITESELCDVRKSTRHRQNDGDENCFLKNDLIYRDESVCMSAIESNKKDVDFLNMENLREISLKLNFKKSDSRLTMTDKSKKVGHVGRALCKTLLGIIPGYFNASSRRANQNGLRICVRGLVPNSPASKQPDIRIGDCLRLVNGREVTWGNIDDVFTNLTQIESKKVRIVLQDVSRSATVPILIKEKVSTDEESLVKLVTGCSSYETEQTKGGETTPYSVLYLDLEKLKSEENMSDEDVTYQYPSDEDLLSSLRGCFVTMYQIITELSGSNVKRSSFLHQGETIHVGYHKEESGLLLAMYSAKKVDPTVLPSLVTDIVRVLRVQYGSVPEAFSTKHNFEELNNFFCLFHHSMNILRLPSRPHSTYSDENSAMRCLSCFSNVQYLPIYSSFKDKVERIVNSFEASDFFDMSDSFYGCRRTYTVLGSCLFYKAQVLCNHLPKQDLVDLHLYLRYHNLLSLSKGEIIDQLVIWREVHPTRQWYDLGEEQMFGYTEPVSARWFWLVVGYKHSLLCILLETGGCTTKLPTHSMPDPFYIDQSRATLMQIIALDLPAHCDTDYSSPIHSLTCQVECSPVSSTSPVRNSTRDSGSPVRRKPTSIARKESFQSDGSSTSNSSGGSAKKVMVGKTRLFPLDYSSGDPLCPENLNSNKIKLTIGAENCLFHFLHIDKLEGIFISPSFDSGKLEKEIIKNFHVCCTKIKHMFDKYRYRKKQPVREDPASEYNLPPCPDSSFYHLREEGVLFHVPAGGTDNQIQEAYWVVGRQRTRAELYVCFKDKTPQNMVELAFRIGFGLKI